MKWQPRTWPGHRPLAVFAAAVLVLGYCTGSLFGANLAGDVDVASAATPAPTAAADILVGPNAIIGFRLFPADNPWNTDISTLPVKSNSLTYLTSMGLNTGVHPDFGTVWNGAPNGIPYVLVRGTQPKVPITFYYADESDPGPYPIPIDAPIEGGPSSTGDRHILTLDVDNHLLYEVYDARYNSTLARWEAGSGAIWNLDSNNLRPAGWTSADAAGLPILPGLVRYDEVQSGEITHALRFTVSRTQRAYVYPATHFASDSTDSSLPPMGLRVRLKAGYDISGFPAEVQVILRALKKYGMIVADNGGPFYISGAPDPRWNDDALHAISQVKGSDFEVVEAPSTPEAPGSTYQTVWRFRNLKNGHYLWTADEAEKDTIVRTLKTTWLLEGPAYQINTTSNSAPLWRFVNLRGGYYLYSADPNERDTIVRTLSNEWRLEGPAYHVSTATGNPVWRFRNRRDGTYLLSADPAEKDTIVRTLSAIWQLEGPAFYIAP